MEISINSNKTTMKELNFLEKPVREWNGGEFQKAQNYAQARPFSPFAKFHQDLCGYFMLRWGKEYYPFEAWADGYRDGMQIIIGKTPIKCERRYI